MTFEENTGHYKTVLKPSPEVIYKERKSKFYGYAFPLAAEQDAGPLLEGLRKKYRNISHVCYAWRIGKDGQAFRAYDDGEPTHTAGAPILGQLQAFGLTNVLVAVVRIYGGIKLGAGGLANAYRTTARMALEASEIVVRHAVANYEIGCPYEAVDKVLRILRSQGVEIISQDIQAQCRILVGVRRKDEASFAAHFHSLIGVTLTVNTIK